MTAIDHSTSSALTISSIPSLKLLLVNASGPAKRKQDDTKFRIKALVNLIENEKPDIVFFVEFMWQSVREKVWKNTGLSKEYVLYLGKYSKQACFLYNENKIDILSINRDDFDIYNKMSNEYKDLLPRSCQIKIRWNTEEIVCICWHGPHTTKKAEDKGTLCTLLRSYLHELQEHEIPVILGGDFNLDYHKVRTHFSEQLYLVKNNSTGRKDDKCFFITSGLQYDKPVALDWKEKCSVKNAQDMFDHDPILTCLQRKTRKSANITSSMKSHGEFTVQEPFLNQGQRLENPWVSKHQQTTSKKRENKAISGDEKLKPPEKINWTDVRDRIVFEYKKQEHHVQHPSAAQDDDNTRNIRPACPHQSVQFNEKRLDSSIDASECNLDKTMESNDNTDYGKANEIAAVLKLPFDIPENIKNTINKLIQFAKTCSEGKHFFTEAVDIMLFEVDLWSRKLVKGQRSKLYSYLATVLPLTQSTLSKRVNKLHQRHQLQKLTQKLEEEVKRMMPEQKERWLECKIFALQKQKECRIDEQSNNGDVIYRRDNNDQMPVKLNAPKGPRRKFKWTESVRSLLCQVVQLKLKSSNLTKTKPEKVNQILQAFLDEDIKRLWPKYWMQTRTVWSNNDPNKSKEKEFAVQKAALSTHGTESAVKMEPSFYPNLPIIKEDPEKGGYRDRTQQEDYAPLKIVASGKLQPQLHNTPSKIVTSGKPQQQQHITPLKIVSPGKKQQKRVSEDIFTDDECKLPYKISRADEEISDDLDFSRVEQLLLLRTYQIYPNDWHEIIEVIKDAINVLPKDVQLLYSLSSTDQIQKRLTRELNTMLFSRTSDDPEIRYEVEQIRQIHQGIITDVSSSIPQASGSGFNMEQSFDCHGQTSDLECINFSRVERLLLLRTYQIYPDDWHGIIEVIKEAVNVLPKDAQLLYSQSSTDQIQKRLTRELRTMLFTTTSDDPEIRSEIEKIRSQHCET